VLRKRQKEKIISSTPPGKYRIFLHQVKAAEMHLPSHDFEPNATGHAGPFAHRLQSNLRAADTFFFLAREG
jgi:hypothetical protein